MMRLAALIVALLIGVGGLSYAVTCDTTSWTFPWLLYLIIWLPVTSFVSLAVLMWLVLRLALNWQITATVVAGLALLQSIALWMNADSRITLSVMPAGAMALAIAGIACDRGFVTERVSKMVNRCGWLGLAAVLLATAGCFLHLVRERDLAMQRLAEWKAEHDRKSQELRGLPRAAWLLDQAFYMDGFSELDFLREKSCQLHHFGEVRWDDERERLVITQRLFDDETQKRLLPHVDAVLAHPLLKIGERDDLDGGELICEPELNCRVEWVIDVDVLTDDLESQKILTHSTDFIGRLLLQELAK